MQLFMPERMFPFQFEELREAPNADRVWPELADDEFVILELDLLIAKEYFRCKNIHEGRMIVQATGGAAWQRFFVAGPRGEE